MAKKYTLKVYDKTGTTYRGSFENLASYSFSKTINGGCGSMSITLPRKFDDYGYGEDVNLLDQIHVWVKDKDSKNGVKIYSGFISKITSKVSGTSEDVVLEVLGFAARLGMTLDKGPGPSVSIAVARNSQTPGESVQDIIDSYRYWNDELISYSVDSIDTTGTDVSYTSSTKSYLDSIERFRQMAGADWYWYLDADNILYFKPIPSEPTHIFTFQKDISYISIERNVDDIKNTLVFWNGLQSGEANFLSKIYYSGTSTTAYGESFEKLTDSRVTDQTTADALGESYVNTYKDPNTSLEFEIKDNNFGDGYDIETIEPGQTCKILNIKGSDQIGANMLITGVTYFPERVIVRVSDLRNLTGRTLTEIRRMLDSTVYSDGVATATLDDVDS